MEKVINADAAWVAGRELRHKVAVVLRDGNIADILPRDRAPRSLESFDCQLLLPGFINSHCHLEYSFLADRLPRPGNDFPAWLDKMYAAKTGAGAAEYVESTREGLRLSAAGGTTTIIDTIHQVAVGDALVDSPVRIAAMWELIALDADRAKTVVEQVLAAVERPLGANHVVSGISPHAPYTVGTALRGQLRELLARLPDLLTAWHLAETQGEVDLLMHGRGMFAEFFAARNIPLAFEQVPECMPTEFLAKERLLDRCDCAYHLNFPAAADAEFFRAPRLVVHCPGTHEWFDRSPFPMWDLLAAGTNVALGTDSLASCESLSMLRMLQIAAGEFPFLTGPQLLDLVTRNPARSSILQRAPHRLGIIERGAAADFTVLECSTLDGAYDIRELLLHGATRVAAAFVGGQQIA